MVSSGSQARAFQGRDLAVPFRGSAGATFNTLGDTTRDPSRGRGVVLLDIGAQRSEVGGRLGRPDRNHERLGIGRSFSLPQESIQSLTCSCGIPAPSSSDFIACLMPATCHSLTSRYSLIASAARTDRLRPVLLANRSRRLLAAGSIRTVHTVERMRVIGGA